MFATKSASAKSSTLTACIAILLLALLIGLVALAVFAAEAETGSGGAAAPNPRDPRGQPQEDAVRDSIRKEGYEQPYGKTDTEIRTNLNIEGKTADIVGYHPGKDHWLIAESKGGNLDVAYAQLKNTAEHLVAREPTSLGKIEMRIYAKADQYAKFFAEPYNISGWRLSESYLGWIDEATGKWTYAELVGSRIVVLAAP